MFYTNFKPGDVAYFYNRELDVVERGKIEAISATTSTDGSLYEEKAWSIQYRIKMRDGIGMLFNDGDLHKSSDAAWPPEPDMPATQEG